MEIECSQILLSLSSVSLLIGDLKSFAYTMVLELWLAVEGSRPTCSFSGVCAFRRLRGMPWGHTPSLEGPRGAGEKLPTGKSLEVGKGKCFLFRMDRMFSLTYEFPYRSPLWGPV